MTTSTIFEPARIKSLALKNRIYVTPMVTRFSVPDTGLVEPGTVEHYRRLAAGGPGLIIQEATCVSPDGRLMDRQLGIWSDTQVEGLHRITDAVHAEGCSIFIQLHHAGVVGIAESPLCPDSYRYVAPDGTEKTGRRMTEDDIHTVQQQFVQAAVRAWKAGYDGVELHGCHQYLICQFLNRKVNGRSDRYGTDPLLFVQEILEDVRRQVPASFVVGIRLGGFEPTLEDGIRHAQRLEELGIDFLDISYGFQKEQEISCPEGYPFQSILYAAEKIRQAVSVPVLAANGITSPEMANEALQQTGAEMIGVGRGFIVNPDWMKDAIRHQDTGKCLHCRMCRLYDAPERCPGKLLFERQKASQ